jgi:hypothetical protein
MCEFQAQIIGIGSHDACAKVEKNIGDVMEERSVMTTDVEQIVMQKEIVNIDCGDGDGDNSGYGGDGGNGSDGDESSNNEDVPVQATKKMKKKNFISEPRRKKRAL